MNGADVTSAGWTAHLDDLAAVLEALPDPVLVVGETQLVTAANRAGADLLRRTSLGTAGGRLHDLLSHQDNDAADRAVDAIGRAVAWDERASLPTTQGAALEVQLRGAPVPHAARVRGVITVDLRPATGAPTAEPAGGPAGDLAAELATALVEDQIVLHYQPIVRLNDRRPVAVEALVRWEHPARGLLMPGAFLPAADSAALAEQLGVRVLRLACHAVAGWTRALRPARRLQVAVNLSSRQLLQPGLTAVVRDALTVAGCDPDQLLLEVNEDALSGAPEAALQALTSLKELGVAIAVDDLGTGSSAASYLTHFPIDLVKIDRSLVAGLGSDPEQSAVVASLVSLSQAMGVRCVAEGVETADQMGVLRRLGCDLGQGYLFTRAMSAGATLEWLGRALTTGARAPLVLESPRSPESAQRALELQAEGASLHTIAARLNAEGHRNAGGRRWHHTSVAQLIASHRFPDL